MFIYGGGRSFGSFFLLIGRGGDYESGGGAATLNPFPAENIPEVACQDQGILLPRIINVMQDGSLLSEHRATGTTRTGLSYKTIIRKRRANK